MKKSVGFIIVAMGILMYATLLLVGIPSLQLEGVQAHPEHTPLTAQEIRGREIYVQNGCFYCHSQQPRDENFGPDALRNWGRYAIPADYVGDRPHLLGTMRTGPDLHNIGVRQPSEDWHLVHLYQPRAALPNSVMPSYPYLFLTANEAQPGHRVVPVPSEHVTGGQVVIATEDALALVAYLKSLQHNQPIEEFTSDYLPPEAEE